MSYTLIAENFDFGPYVPSINNHGVVAFTVGSEVLCGDGGPLRRLLAGDFHSHPDINDNLQCCVYGRRRVWGVAGDFERVGPLGPTMNESGQVAFRADGAIFLGERRLAAGAFEGLPVTNAAGTVVFRSDTGIYTTLGVVADFTTFVSLGHFPDINDEGTVVFTGDHTVSGPGVFTSSRQVVAGFPSVRGALINNAGQIVFYATPTGGSLGIYAQAGRLLSIGDSLWGARVTEFALNPVSFNDLGQLAIRIGLSNGRRMIVRRENLTPAET